MATNKYINARLQQKHDIEANWITAGNNGFVPLAGEIIIYDIDDECNYYRLKIGDGITNINELIFTNTPEQIDWDAVGVPYHISEKIIPEQTLELKPNFLLEFYGNTTQAIERLIVGETYLVNWEGKEYLCIAQEVPQEHGYDNAVYIGNSIITNGGILDTLPFVIGTSEAGYNAFVIDLELNKTAVTFSCTKERIKTIDPLCLDFDWIPNFGMLNKGKEILSETTVTKSSLYGTFMFTSSAPYYFKNKQAYLIEWNHKPYAAIYNFISDESSSPTNSYGQFSTEDFTILSWFDPSEAEGARNRLDCFDKKNNLSEVTLAIYELDAENKLPNSFLDLDWKPISEKYDRLINNSVVYSFTLHHDDIYCGDVLYSVKIKKNTSYKVKWEDQFYEVIGKEVEYDGSTCIGLGNFSLLNSDNEDTNEPFLIIFTAGPYSVNKLFTRSNAQRAVSIYDNEIVYNKIPKEFLPEGYPYISEGVALPETTFEVTYEDGIPFGQGMIVDKFILEKDCEYEVTWNDTTYNCIGTEVELSGIPAIALGDIEKDPNTDSLNYPFGIVNVNDEIATAAGAYAMIYVYDSSAEVTLSINGSTIHKIDSRFIPDLGVVTNIVNGDHVGSIRSISASQNNDEYQIGPFAVAFGLETKASGDSSHAEGFTTIASGIQSHAEGYDTEAKGEASHAEGGGTQAVGNCSHAEGSITVANGFASHAEGYGTTASGDYSHAQGKSNIDDDTLAHIVGNGSLHKRSNAHTLDWDGNAWFAGNVYVGSTSGTNKDEGSKKLITTEDMEKKPGKVVTGETFIIDSISRVAGKNAEVFNGINNIAIGDYSHAEGNGTTAFGYYSHAEGHNTTAFDNASHAEGNETTASGYASHAEGGNTIASETYSHAEGLDTEASGYQSHAEGFNTTASGESSHAEGSVTTASEAHSHAEGSNTTASGSTSHAEGNHTTASGHASHAEGDRTTASGSSSHAEGRETTASERYSHAEGYNTTASGTSSHAEGDHTTASGDYSHAEGYNTTASGDCSHVQGRYNVEDVNEQYAHIVGNGVYNKRSNAHTLDWSGNAWFAGDVYVGSTSGVNKDEGSKKLVTEDYVNNLVNTKSQVQFITWEADD